MAEAHKKDNWVDLEIKLPEKYLQWLKDNVPTDDIKETPKPHITLLYGFDPLRFDEVKAIVDAENIQASDYMFGDVRLGDVSPVYLVGIKSEKLDALFWKLYKQFPNQHTLIAGKFDPHVTLCWLKDWPAKKQ